MRPLAPFEADHLARLLSQIDPWRRLGFSAATLGAYLTRTDPALRRLVVEHDGRPAGLLALRAPWLRGPYIELLAVLPEAQGMGLGRSLVDWACAEARQGKSPNLWACVSAFNAPARRFYDWLGFREVAPLPDLAAPGETEILLRRSL